MIDGKIFAGSSNIVKMNFLDFVKTVAKLHANKKI
jgi:hypothetical protein